MIYQPIDYNPGFNFEICTWSGGTDEQIVNIIHAAREHKIDLQQDAGWAVGDERIITIDTSIKLDNYSLFTFSSQPIVITSFDEYENCGNVLQFDFKKCNGDLALIEWGVNTNAGGYQNSMFYRKLLPVAVQALPVWLQLLLLPFSVQANQGITGATTIMVPNNKLALRSLTEVLASTTHGTEGQALSYYTDVANRLKLTSSQASTWALRTASTTSSEYHASINSSGNQTMVVCYPNEGYVAGCYLAPFGCI